MEKVRVYRYGKREKDMYPHHNWLQRVWFRIVLLFKRALAIGVVLFFAWVGLEAYRYANPVYKVEATEVAVDPEYPVLKRIAKAESLDSHYCTDTLIKARMCASSEKGQVLVRSNTDKNKTIDVGRYQINVYYWGAKATELGYNIFDENDNRKMAEWIYKNHGTEPWGSSSKKW